MTEPELSISRSRGGGIAKLVGSKTTRSDAQRFGFSDAAYRLIGGAEPAAAIGLIGGLFVWQLGASAATGLVALLAGAVVVHTRVRDPATTYTAPIAIGLLAAAIAALHLLVKLSVAVSDQEPE